MKRDFFGQGRDIPEFIESNQSDDCDDFIESDACDLDETKICDNCCRCLGDSDYRAIEVERIIIPEKVKYNWLKSKKK